MKIIRTIVYLSMIIFFSLLLSYDLPAGQLETPPGPSLTTRLERMREEIQRKGYTFTVGDNPALHYTIDELCGLKEPPGWREGAPVRRLRVLSDLPSAFDWRDYGIITPIRNQGGCGSCWAFGSVGPLEANILWKDSVEVDLSEQWLVSCTDAGSCSGGWWAHDHHVNPGAVLEEDFPYVAGDAPCGGPYNHPYQIESWAYIGSEWGVPSVDGIKQAIYTYGPVSVAVYVGNFFQGYTDGIFNSNEVGQVNHAVVLVGWDNNEGYWILRNSWGTGWGENGYMYITYGTSQVGYSANYIVYSETIPPEIEVEPTAFNVNLTPGGELTCTLTISNTGEGPLSFSIGWQQIAKLGSSGGPDDFGYSWKDSNEAGGPVYSWAEISSVGTPLNLGDEDYASVSLPFTFNFYGQEKGSISICSNGYLTFGDALLYYYDNGPIPDPDDPNDMIAPFWDDLDPGEGGQIYYYFDQSNQRFIVEYKNVVHYDWFFPGDPETFEVILYPDGRIVYQYQTVSNTQYDVTGCTVGIENAAGTIGLQVAYNNSNYPRNRLAIELTYTQPWLSFSPRSGNIPAHDSLEVEVNFDATELSPGIYQANIIINSNDSDEGELIIPVTMNVGASSGFANSGDYNGDGTDDIAIFRGRSALWAIRGITRIYYGSASDLPVSGDYNGDGTTDIAIHRVISGLWSIRSVTRFYWGSSSHIPVAGDYDGDGCCDAGTFVESRGRWNIKGVTRTYFGTSGDTPVTGDFNGDGTDEIGIFRGRTGMWVLKSISRIYFGKNGDLASVNDYNGDNTSDIAIFRPSLSLWAIRGITRCYFGTSGDTPAPADYDGLEGAELGIFRNSNGLWVVQGITRCYFGSNSDIPVTK